MSDDLTREILAKKIADQIGAVNQCNAHSMANLMRDIAEDLDPHVQINPDDLEKSFSDSVDIIRLTPIMLTLSDAAFHDYGDLSIATELAQALKNLDETNVEALTHYSSYLIQSGGADQNPDEFKKAEKYMLRALEIEPENYEVHAFLGQCYAGQDRADLAKKHFAMAENIAAQGDIKDMDMFADISAFYLHIEDYKTAGQYVDKCIQLEGGAQAAMTMAATFQAADMQNAVILICSRLSRARPNDWMVLNRLGDAYLLKGDTSKAQEYFERGLRATTDKVARSTLFNNASAALLVGYKQFGESGKLHVLQSAGKYLKQALAENPDNGRAWNSYGVYYQCVASLIDTPERKASMLGKAKESFFMAQRMGGDDGFVALNLADVYQDSVRPLEANHYATMAMRSRYPLIYSSDKPEIKDYRMVDFSKTELVRIANNVGGVDPLYEPESGENPSNDRALEI